VKPGVGGEIQLTDALNLLKEGQDVYGYEFIGKRYDIGNMLDWLKSTVELALEDPDIRDELMTYLEGMVKDAE